MKYGYKLVRLFVELVRNIPTLRVESSNNLKKALSPWKFWLNNQN